MGEVCIGEVKQEESRGRRIGGVGEIVDTPDTASHDEMKASDWSEDKSRAQSIHSDP
jgi:hypothetical protein